MEQAYDFNEDERDFLQELLNVAFGSAAAVISDSLETFATLHIPKIKLLDIDELQPYINDKFSSDEQYFVFSQQFRGDLEGEAIFISDHKSIQNLCSVIDEEEEEDHEDVESIIELSSELLNIVNSATIKNLAKDLQKEVFFARPSVKNANSNEIVANTNMALYRTIIVVSTVLDFQKEDINGTLYILFKPKSIDIIKDAAAAFFDEE